MKIKFTFFILSLFCLLTIGHSTMAQNDLEDQINKINGNVDNIIISSDGEEYIFEGADAQKLFKKMKSSKSKSFVWNTSDDGSMKKKVVIVDTDGEKDVIEIDGDDDDVFIVRTDKDFDSIDCGMTKIVKVEVEDGNKKVTVTTNENGEETTEVYEGEEADEYLETMKSDNDEYHIEIDEDNDGKKVKKIIIETEKVEKKK